MDPTRPLAPSLVLRPRADRDMDTIADLWVASWRETMPNIDFSARRDWFVNHISKLEAEGAITICALEQFPAKWTPLRVAKLRQNNNIELHSDSTGRESALDHDDLGSNRSKIMNVIDSKTSERDAGGKPAQPSTFAHPALDPPARIVGFVTLNAATGWLDQLAVAPAANGSSTRHGDCRRASCPSM
jgi:hypothetical protein